MEERRRFARIHINTPVRSESAVILKPVDLSEGGIHVVLGNPMQVGQMTDMQFFFPAHPQKFIARSVVVWQKNSLEGYHTGLRFEDVHVMTQEN